MKLLAIDTATEQCSVALQYAERIFERCLQTPRGHADMILSMVQEVLAAAELRLQDLDAIAFGRGPGAFTGVRIAVGVAQGLAYAWDFPVLAISNLAAVAQQAAEQPGDILVCMDARMGEVYWGVFRRADDGLVTPLIAEQLSAPEQVQLDGTPAVALGTGFGAYPLLSERFASARIQGDALPRATEILRLAVRDFERGLSVSAANAQPVYLRDQVTQVKSQVKSL